MIQLPDVRRPPLTPQLALRVAILGSFALAMFAIIFFRLWFLQVLSGHKYLAQASVNRVRDIAIPRRAGEILDRSGNVLVDSKRAIAVQISPPDLPVPLNPSNLGRPAAQGRAAVRPAGRGAGDADGSAELPGARPRQCSACRRSPALVAQGYAQLPYANVTIKTDVSNDVQYYLAERQNQFPGVEVQQI